MYCLSCDGAQAKCFDNIVKMVLGKFQEQTFVVNFAVDSQEETIMQLKALCAVLQDQILYMTWQPVGIFSTIVTYMTSWRWVFNFLCLFSLGISLGFSLFGESPTTLQSGRSCAKTRKV